MLVTIKNSALNEIKETITYFSLTPEGIYYDHLVNKNGKFSSIVQLIKKEYVEAFELVEVWTKKGMEYRVQIVEDHYPAPHVIQLKTLEDAKAVVSELNEYLF